MIDVLLLIAAQTAPVAQNAPAEPVSQGVIGTIALAALAILGAGARVAWTTVERFLSNVSAQVTAAYADNKVAMGSITTQLGKLSRQFVRAEKRSAVRHEKLNLALAELRTRTAEDVRLIVNEHGKRMHAEFALLAARLGLPPPPDTPHGVNDSQDPIKLD